MKFLPLMIVALIGVEKFLNNIGSSRIYVRGFMCEQMGVEKFIRYGGLQGGALGFNAP